MDYLPNLFSILKNKSCKMFVIFYSKKNNILFFIMIIFISNIFLLHNLYVILLQYLSLYKSFLLNIWILFSVPVCGWMQVTIMITVNIVYSWVNIYIIYFSFYKWLHSYCIYFFVGKYYCGKEDLMYFGKSHCYITKIIIKFGENNNSLFWTFSDICYNRL